MLDLDKIGFLPSDESLKAILKIVELVTIISPEKTLDFYMQRTVVDPPYEELKNVPIADKYLLMRKSINHILNELYEKNIPNLKSNFNNNVEIDVYPVQLILYENIDYDFNKFKEAKKEYVISFLNISEAEFLKNEKSYFEKIGYDFKIFEKYPILAKQFQNIYEKIHFLEYIMNFVPCCEIYKYLLLLYQSVQSKINILNETLEINLSLKNNFKMPFLFESSYWVTPQSVFDSININDLINSSEFDDSEKNILCELKESIDNNEAYKINKPIICPHCGVIENNIKIETKDILVKIISDYREINKKIAFQHFDKIKDHFFKNMHNQMTKFIEKINEVDNPKTLILVEGASEEICIPLLTYRFKKQLLKDKSIKVHNSNSKEKLFEDFLKFVKQYPNLSIVILLDSDADKEFDDINRIIKGRKNLYELFKIDKGTFEDIFNIEESIKVLNSIYPELEEIVYLDFDTEKCFLDNVKRILWNKKKAKFDKVEFAKKIALNIDELPEIIDNIIEKSFELSIV